jgi:hypothetical protein
MRKVFVVGAIAALVSLLAVMSCSTRGQALLDRLCGPTDEALPWPDVRECELVGGGTWKSDERTIVYELTELERGRKYALPIGEGFRDVSGNAAQEFIWTIEVAPGD